MSEKKKEKKNCNRITAMEQQGQQSKTHKNKLKLESSNFLGKKNLKMYSTTIVNYIQCTIYLNVGKV